MHWNKHRKYQVAITLGVLSTACISVLAPHLEHWSLMGAVATNLIWIWE